MTTITKHQFNQLANKFKFKPPVIHGNMILVNGAWINRSDFDKALRNHIKDESKNN